MIRIALIGAGAFGKNYIKVLREVPNVRLHAVCVRGDITAGPYLVLHDWRSAISWPLVDAVIVATPASTHYEIAKACIEARKPALIEKPLAMSVREVNVLCADALEQNVLVHVGYTDLHNQAFEHLSEFNIGLERVEGRVTGVGPIRKDCSPLWDYGPHALAMTLRLFDEYPARIEAERVNVIDEAKQFNASVRLYFSQRRTADLLFGNASTRTRQLKMFTSLHEMCYDGIEGSVTVNVHKMMPETQSALHRQVNAFVSDVAAKKFDVTTLRLSVWVTSVLAECERQLAEKRV